MLKKLIAILSLSVVLTGCAATAAPKEEAKTDDQRLAAEIRRRMEAGASFPDAVESLGIFETLHSRMIRVGFQAGQTDVVMQRLAEIYEDEVDDAIAHTVSIIEPSLVALMSVVIGAILLAVMLPLLSLMGGMA